MLRAWWSARQGLDGSLDGASPAQVLERSGWARSVAGVGPYLTLFSRAGTSREEADAAVQRLEIHELPSARGCTYVVPSRDFAIALKASQAFADAPMRPARKLGVTDREIDALCDGVIEALAKGPLDPDELREATGGLSRSLGEEGKKKGIGTTLPLALGKLQSLGEIRRLPVNGRLDQQRYRYAKWDRNPLKAYRGSVDDAQLEVASRFFRWVGPATVGELQWFLSLGVKASKELVARLELVPMEPGSERLLFPDDADALRAFVPPKKAQPVLVSSLDAISATRRDVRTLLDDADLERTVALDRAVGTLGGLSDLPSHAILDRGRLVGLWEYDVESESIVWASFVGKSRALEEAVAKTESYVREQLGDARSFSLDSPKSRAPRIEALRKMRA
ncbi:hypothetical protein AKJ08_0284 [Vulgatibacter incomptus]|uniref:Winged helix DNA-binding domain-containing protein n=1 Tax=Vulgatibacter incomptus TaxID=1391653 RepID=A0A0K1P8R7_9BACT|nr:hypothetical protein AKJ08_0284 [Vulgatibacter incomptus]